jgi:excisionase family DNA binding protein
MLSVSTKTIRNWIKSGELPAFETGPKLIRISVLDIRAFCKPASSLSWRKIDNPRTHLTRKARNKSADDLVFDALPAEDPDDLPSSQDLRALRVERDKK